MNNIEYFAIGTYTDIKPHAPKACGDGIVVVSLNRNNGYLEIVCKLSDIKNPSYLHWSQIMRKLFSCSESDNGNPGINIIEFDNNKGMRVTGSLINSGNALCHLNFDEENQTLYSVSYDDGCLYKYSINEIGNMKTEDKYIYSGNGPNIQRQESAHAHQVVINNSQNSLYVCDLGSDKVWIHNAQNIRNIRILNTPKGYGPRHLVIDRDKKHIFILCELKPIILIAEICSDGNLKIIDELSIVHKDNNDINAPAGIKIHPSGNSLVCSNRFNDTISVFKIIRSQNQNIKLNLVDIFTSGGNTPRDIEFSSCGNWLIITNQDSSNINTIEFDKESGWPLSYRGNTLELGTPICIVKIT